MNDAHIGVDGDEVCPDDLHHVPIDGEDKGGRGGSVDKPDEISFALVSMLKRPMTRSDSGRRSPFEIQIHGYQGSWGRGDDQEWRIAGSIEYNCTGLSIKVHQLLF